MQIFAIVLLAAKDADTAYDQIAGMPGKVKTHDIFSRRVCRVRSPSATFVPATLNALPPRSAKDQLRSRWFIKWCANEIFLGASWGFPFFRPYGCTGEAK